MEKKKTDDDEIKVIFAPGCFDDFEGTQEELDELIVELTKMMADGTLMEKSNRLNMEDLSEEDILALEKFEKLFEDEDESLDDMIERTSGSRKRRLN